MGSDQSLFDKAEEGLLRRCDLGRICTIDKGGYPHCVRVDYVYHEGSILVGSMVRRKWHSHLSRNSKVAFEIDVYEKKNGIFDFRGLMIKGTAHFIEDARQRKEVIALLRTRHPGAPFGENPIIVRIVPMKRLRWGPWKKALEDP